MLRTVRGAAEFGVATGRVEPTVDLAVSQVRKQKVIDGMVKGLGSLLAGRDVTVYDGTGRLGVDHVVTVDGPDGPVVVAADHVVLATGSTPRTIPGFEVDGSLVVTSDELLSITEVPDRVAVIGGGAIGCEFASMLADYGSAVTLLEAAAEILPGCDIDVAKTVRRSFRRRRIDVHSGVPVHGHDPSDAATTVRFGDDSTVEVDLVVVAVGRRPRGDSAGLVGTRVVVDERGFIQVDDRLRTGEPGVYAVGRLAARPHPPPASHHSHSRPLPPPCVRVSPPPPAATPQARPMVAGAPTCFWVSPHPSAATLNLGRWWQVLLRASG